MRSHGRLYVQTRNILYKCKGTSFTLLNGDQMDIAFAEHFAADWIESWNTHDLMRVLSHYSEDFEMSSPFIVKITGEDTGKLKGKEAVGAYWRKALTLIPDLHFELISVLVGVDSITIYYKGSGGRLAAEVFFFGTDGKIYKAVAHYGTQVLS